MGETPSLARCLHTLFCVLFFACPPCDGQLSALDGFVLCGGLSLIKDVWIDECSNQISMLNMHNEMYATLMDVYLPGAAVQAQLIAETKAMPSAQKKTTWCQQWMDSKASFGLRLVAFAAVQSVMHAGTFASFHFMNERKKLTGLVHVSWIDSCSALHCRCIGFRPAPQRATIYVSAPPINLNREDTDTCAAYAADRLLSTSAPTWSSTSTSVACFSPCCKRNQRPPTLSGS